MASINLCRVSTSKNLHRVERIKKPEDELIPIDNPSPSCGTLLHGVNGAHEPDNYESTDRAHPSTSSIPYDDGMPLELMRESFQNDGFILFHDAVSPSLVSTLQSRLEEVLRGNYNRGFPPDKIPRFLMDSAPKKQGKKASKTLGPLGYDPNSNSKNRVLQIINIHKCDAIFRELATSPDIGKMVAELAGWEHGARLAQDQVWAKPPGAPPIVFHRDSPYFMFMPEEVVTVWIALDDMDSVLGPLEYVQGSHKWGDGRVGSASAFFQSDNGMNLLHSAALLEGISDPSSALKIFTTSGLRSGGISIHHGKTWHGSGKNCSTYRPRRGLGIHYVPAEVRFTKAARNSKLWKSYIPDDVSDEDLVMTELLEEDFPLVWKPF